MRLSSRLLRAASGLVISLAVASPALAQDDVLVMRRAIAPNKNASQTPTPTPTSTDPSGQPMTPVDGADTSGHYWVTSGWIKGEPACTASATETRLRGCVYQGQPADESTCPAPAPETSRTVEDSRACTYSWLITPSGNWAAQCSNTTRPVTASCQKQDGTIVADSMCAGQAKPTEQTGFNEQGCTYSWAIGEYGNWNSTCSDEAKRERSVVCMRSDGSDVPDAKCTEEKPEAQETAPNYSYCAYNWKGTPWIAQSQACGQEVVETRTVTCARADGEPADESQCTGARIPSTRNQVNYDACSYRWQEGTWSDWSSTCSANALRTRTVTCERLEDGQVGREDKCDAGSKPQVRENRSDFSGCGYSWVEGDWERVQACSPSVTVNRSVTCRRADGAVASDESLCTQPKPSMSKETANYESCTFSWKSVPNGGWSSTCSDSATRQNTVTCERSDGTVMTDQSSCDPENKPADQDTSSNYSGCPTAWSYGEWSAWSSTCSPTAERTRLVRCQQQKPSGPEVVPSEQCSGAPGSGREVAANYSNCQPTWSTGAWGWNGTAGAKSSTCSATPQQNRTITCQKRDAGGILQTVPDSECGDKDVTTRALMADYDGCSYDWYAGDWSAWTSTCSTKATRSRVVQCQRSDGTPTANGGLCTKAKPSASEGPTTNVTDCQGKIANPGFEDDLDTWSMVLGSGTPSITTDSKVGSKAAMITMAAGSLNNFGTNIGMVPGGASFTVNLWCRAALSNTDVDVYLSGGDDGTGKKLGGYSVRTKIRCQQTWTAFSFSISNPTVTSYNNVNIVFTPVLGTKTFYLDDVIVK